MSSPPRLRAFDTAPVSSSSPYLPSLDEIFMKKSPTKAPFRTRNQATRGPATTQPTFTNAAHILREAPEIDIETETISSSPPRRSKAENKSPSRQVLTSHNPSNDSSAHQSSTVIKSLSPKDKPWQKFKSKKPLQNGDKCIPSTIALPSERRSNNRTELVSPHFATSKDDNSLPQKNVVPDGSQARKEEMASSNCRDIDTPSELAVPRRSDWTPPRPTKVAGADYESDSRELFSSAGKGQESKGIFRTLHDQFGRQDSDQIPATCPEPQAEVLRKRKRIELVSTGRGDVLEGATEGSALGGSERLKDQKRANAKAPEAKRRITTITELAIAPFVAPPAPHFDLGGPANKESLLDYFDADGTVKALVEHQSVVMSQRQPTAKATKKPPKTSRRRKTGTQAHPILLSPSSALKQSSNQDFVFGTSSQLVQEDSPITLKNVQAAIRLSNTLSSDPFDDDVGRRLWRAGARDEDGELMGMEIVDLRRRTAIEANITATPGSRSFVDINDLLDSPRPMPSVPSTLIPSELTNAYSFPSESAEQRSCSVPTAPEISEAPTSTEPRPNYALFTDAQLSKQITSYGFKPVKKRTTMIALLDQCWASKHPEALATPAQSFQTAAYSTTQAQQQPTSDSPNKVSPKPRGRGRGRPKKTDNTDPPVDNSAPTNEKPTAKRSRTKAKKKEAVSAHTEKAGPSIPSPKRPRGRPRKSSVTSIEIPDSENETLSPTSSPEPVFSSPPPIELTVSDEGDMSLMLSPTDQQAELFKHITKAVTSTPRSQDPSNPSWHEKMLLYDPIILEELASWLNSGELSRVGYDGEVSPFDVKKWCESKSVVCLWQKNLNGKERKRH
ncbi:hypothetical protein F4777DRAFT_549586 [Nemania sp. FL0916]|nr:hypothetical protein F4777DRAFT_549586 [Nemania sp. FL0916]